jgi:hypothetical protein
LTGLDRYVGLVQVELLRPLPVKQGMCAAKRQTRSTKVSILRR